MPPRVRAASQPASGASMMLNTRATSPMVASSAPPVSTRGAPGWEDSGTKRIVPAIATAARTTLTAKAARQENHSSRIPVHSRPSTELPPAAQDDEVVRGGDRHRRRRGGAEDDQPGDKRFAAAVAVAESAGREQQDGEDQQVGVDDPFELGLAGVGAADQAGDGDVQRRHRGRDRPEGDTDDHGDDRAVVVSEGGVFPRKGLVNLRLSASAETLYDR